MWVRRPAAPVVAVVSLALAIAAATAVFTVTDAALWRPLPFPDPQRLVWITTVDRDVAGATAPGVYSQWAARAATLDAIGAIRAVEGTLRDEKGTDRVPGALVTAGFFEALRGHAAAGRLLTAGDELADAPPVAVISGRLWRRRYGSNPDVVGRTIELDGRARTLVGVMSDSFGALPIEFDWLTPLTFSARQAANIGPRYLDVIGRLAASSARASQSELSGIAQSAGATGDTGLPLSARVETVQSHFAAAPSRILVPLFVSVLVLVGIAAANAANLMLAHGQRRRGEIAIRASLGATRSRLVRQLATEAGLIALAAGALSVLLAQWLADPLVRALPPELSRSTLRFDLRTALFTVSSTFAVTMLIGLVPALRNSRTDLRSGLNAASRGILSGNDRLRRAFVVAQVALAMSLGMAGLLMLRTTWALTSAPRGYDADRVLTAALSFPAAGYAGGDDIRRAIERIVGAAAGNGAVRRAAVATRVPLSGGAPGSDVALFTEPFSSGVDRQTKIRFVTPGFFDTVGTPILDGRDVSDSDASGSPLVVLVNETLARRLSPSEPIVGKAIKLAVADFNEGGTRAWRVVGRVADSRDRGPRQPAEPELYISVSQGPAEVFEWIGRRVLLAVQSTPAGRVTASDLKAALTVAAPDVPLFDAQTLDERFAGAIARERLLADLLLPLAAAGALLAGFGVFAVVTQLVVSRRRELALRMVLGATPGRILMTALNEGWSLAVVGVVFGAAAAMAAGRGLQSLTFGVGLIDPRTLAVVVTALLATITAAVWWPAWRASKLDPATVLRES